MINVFLGDITELHGTPYAAQAIVNAANERLVAGSGVCGAIFRAAGLRHLQQACHSVAPCPTGNARITPAFDLASQGVEAIIHAVGPRFSDASSDAADRLLADAYRASISCLRSAGLTSIAYPSISTGVFGFPLERAAAVSVRTLREVDGPDLAVTLVAFNEQTKLAWEEALAAQ